MRFRKDVTGLIMYDHESISANILRWLSGNIDYFSVNFWQKDHARSNFPWGPQLELAQILNVVPKQLVKDYFKLELFLQLGRELWSFPAGSNAFILLGRQAYTNLSELYEIAEFPDIWFDLPGGKEEFHISDNFGTSLERGYLKKYLNMSDYSNDFLSAIRSYLSVPQQVTLPEDTVYYLTHLIMYSTQYGRVSGERVFGRGRVYQRLLADLTSAFQTADTAGNFDLLAETGAALCELGEHNSLTERCQTALLSQISQYGHINAVIRSGEVMQDSRHEFRDSYHTMIASLLFAVNYAGEKTPF